MIEGTQSDYIKPYRLNVNDRTDLDTIIIQYRKAGIIKDTKAYTVSPAFIVQNSEGKPRMVTDYRFVNKNTKTYYFPIPSIEELLEKLHGAKIFIKLDLTLGYLQMPLSEKSKELTAFITETQTGQFKRAMFRLVNAPMYFSKLMDQILGNVKRKGLAFMFFDDICFMRNLGLN